MTTPYEDRNHNDLRRIAKARNLNQGSHPTKDDLVKLLQDDDTNPSYDQWSEEYQREVLKERNVETDGKSKDALLPLLKDTAPQSAQAAAGPSKTDERGSRAGSEDTVIMNPAEKGHPERNDDDGSQDDDIQGDGNQGDGSQGGSSQGDGSQGDGSQGDGSQDDGEQFFEAPSGDASAKELKDDEDSQTRREAAIPSVEPADDSTIMFQEGFEDVSFASSPKSRSPTRFDSAAPVESARTTPGVDSGKRNEGAPVVSPIQVPGRPGTTGSESSGTPTPVERRPDTSGSDTTTPTTKQQDPVASEPVTNPSTSSSASKPVGSTPTTNISTNQLRRSARHKGRGGLLQELLASANPSPSPKPPQKDLPAASTSTPVTTSNQKKPPVRRKAKGGFLQDLLASSNPPPHLELLQEPAPTQVLSSETAKPPQATWPGTTKFSWKEHFKNFKPVLPYDPFKPNPSRPKEGFTDIGPFTDDPERWVSFTDPWSEKQYDGFILGLSRKQQLLVEYVGSNSWSKSRGAVLPVPLFTSKRNEYNSWAEKNDFRAEIQYGSEDSLDGLPSRKIDRWRSIVFEFTASRECNTRSGDTVILLRLVPREPDKEDNDDKEVQDRFYNRVHDHFYTRRHLELVFGNDIKTWIRQARPTPQDEKAREKRRNLEHILQDYELEILQDKMDESEKAIRELLK